MTIAIGQAGAADLGELREMFGQYAVWLRAAHGIALDYQGFADELAGLPGDYAPPRGALLLARTAEGDAAGCIALRPLAPGVCEVKRLFVRPAARGAGLGARLVGAVLAEARARGYARACLDTAAGMTGVRALYAAQGFRPIAPYTDRPYDNILFMGCALT